jgi:hypothetical protein
VAYDANPAATHDPTTGVVVPTNWLDLLNANFAYLGAAWTSFSPSWTGSVSNPAIGNGTLSGAYLQVGKTLLGRIRMVAGTTTTFGSGDFRFTLPNSLSGVAAQQVVHGIAYDSSSGIAYALMGIVAASATFMYLFSHGSATRVAAAAPMAWATSDELVVNFHLEVA